MIVEIAEIFVRPGTQAQFDEAIVRGLQTVVSRSPGFLRYEVLQGIETPERYVLRIEWERLENHTVDFRGSPAFGLWREIVGPYFARAPHVEHFERLAGR